MATTLANNKENVRRIRSCCKREVKKFDSMRNEGQLSHITDSLYLFLAKIEKQTSHNYNVLM
jgi:hypothetical protein